MLPCRRANLKEKKRLELYVMKFCFISLGNSLAGSDRSMGGYLKPTTAIRTMNQEALDMLEYPFITMQQYPPGFVLHIGM